MTQNATEQWVDISNFGFSKLVSIVLGDVIQENIVTLAKNPRIESGELKTEIARIIPNFGRYDNIEGRYDNFEGFTVYMNQCIISRQNTESAQYCLRDRDGHEGPVSIETIRACDHDWINDEVSIQIGMDHEDNYSLRFKRDPIVYPDGTSLQTVLRDNFKEIMDWSEESPQDAMPCDQGQPESALIEITTGKLPRFEVRPLSAEDGGGYLLEFPDYPGCMADGDTPEQAVAEGSDALKSYLATQEGSGTRQHVQ